ncbi:TlpA disulfide reductase family protein [Bartonella vinsonii]|uniref:Thiol:disulfide interchange protein n=1 Tax=Bartonella vinsonii subsp. berkhoffii str. Tweed TaxID=1094502 RepID=N6UL41_BARVB|nr:TlpA disulfide reductase family protein [Bartonella vinsonii]ENN93084.1 thiol:disulfide interchange protein [Bartonella vinsonii subsp. berkhoffii str. Tweed]
MFPQIFIRKKRQRFLLFSIIFPSFIIALSIYATITHSHKKVQAINTDKARAEQMMAIKKAAKGFFTHMRFADTLSDMKELSFKDIQGKDYKLNDFTGKPMLVNLWAIWCAPCRTEMPELAQLKRELGGENFDVIAINIDKTASPEKIQKFLQDIHADNLLYYRDETMDIFNNVRKQGLALGLPVTFLIDKNGYLIASFNGAAPWADDDAKALIRAFIKEAL